MRTHTYRTAQQFNGNATVRSGTTANTRLRERQANTTVRSDTTANARVRDRNVRFSDQARVRSNVTVNRDRSFRNRTFSGNTTISQNLNAQFVSRRLNLGGQGDLVMLPNPNDGVPIATGNFALIR